MLISKVTFAAIVLYILLAYFWFSEQCTLRLNNGLNVTGGILIVFGGALLITHAQSARTAHSLRVSPPPTGSLVSSEEFENLALEQDLDGSVLAYIGALFLIVPFLTEAVGRRLRKQGLSDHEINLLAARFSRMTWASVSEKIVFETNDEFEELKVLQKLQRILQVQRSPATAP